MTNIFGCKSKQGRFLGLDLSTYLHHFVQDDPTFLWVSIHAEPKSSQNNTEEFFVSPQSRENHSKGQKGKKIFLLN